MSPETIGRVVTTWVGLYTRGLPPPAAERRAEEVAADVHDHIAHARTEGTSDRRIAFDIASRMVRGCVADVAWRDHVLSHHPWPADEARRRSRSSYRRAALTAVVTGLVLVWMVGALGIIGDSGDRADLMYGGVLAIGAVGALLTRFRAAGMARVLATMAVAQMLVAAIAIVGGMVPSYNTWFEVVALSGFFAALFLVAAMLFRRAGLQRRRY